MTNYRRKCFHCGAVMCRRLSSYLHWPIDFHYHSQAEATGYSCVGYVKTVVDFVVGQQCKKNKVVFSSLRIGLGNKVRAMSRNTAPSAPAPNTGPGYW